MSGDEILWEPRWDFGVPADPYVSARMPYDLDDPDFLRDLRARFAFGYIVNMPICDRQGQRCRWSELAELLGNELKQGAEFWEAIGVEGHDAQVRVAGEWDEPYFGQIDIATWQCLRWVFGLPSHGLLYADYILYSNDGEPADVAGAPVQKSPGGYRYLSGTCVGETTEGHFHDAGTSCCWTPGEWLASVGRDLTRAIVCFQDESRVDALFAEAELEIHPSWG